MPTEAAAAAAAAAAAGAQRLYDGDEVRSHLFCLHVVTQVAHKLKDVEVGLLGQQRADTVAQQGAGGARVGTLHLWLG